MKRAMAYSPYRYVLANNPARSDHPSAVLEELCQTLLQHPARPGDLGHLIDEDLPPKNICVIGGGIAGLTAAFELSSRKHKVRLLEQSASLGGRISTHKFDDGTYGELGPMRIPKSHRCVLDYVDHFRIPKREFVNRNVDAYLFLRGNKERIYNYPRLLRAYDLTEPEVSMLRKNEPLKYFDGTFLSKLAALMRPDDLRDLFTGLVAKGSLEGY